MTLNGLAILLASAFLALSAPQGSRALPLASPPSSRYPHYYDQPNVPPAFTDNTNDIDGDFAAGDEDDASVEAVAELLRRLAAVAPPAARSQPRRRRPAGPAASSATAAGGSAMARFRPAAPQAVAAPTPAGPIAQRRAYGVTPCLLKFCTW